MLEKIELLFTGLLIGGLAGAASAVIAFYIYKFTPAIEYWKNGAYHYKSQFEAKEKEYNDLVEERDREAQEPYFLQRTCGYLIPNKNGGYFCEALSAPLKNQCPTDKDAICQHFVKKAGKTQCRGHGHGHKCANNILYEDYLPSMNDEEFNGLCYECKQFKINVKDPIMQLLGEHMDNHQIGR